MHSLISRVYGYFSDVFSGIFRIGFVHNMNWVDMKWEQLIIVKDKPMELKEAGGKYWWLNAKET